MPKNDKVKELQQPEEPKMPDPNAIVEQARAAILQTVQQSQLPSSVIKLILENLIFQVNMAEQNFNKNNRP